MNSASNEVKNLMELPNKHLHAMGVSGADRDTDNGDLEAELDRLEEMENKKIVRLGAAHSDTPPFMVTGRDNNNNNGKDSKRVLFNVDIGPSFLIGGSPNDSGEVMDENGKLQRKKSTHRT